MAQVLKFQSSDGNLASEVHLQVRDKFSDVGTMFQNTSERSNGRNFQVTLVIWGQTTEKELIDFIWSLDK